MLLVKRLCVRNAVKANGVGLESFFFPCISDYVLKYLKGTLSQSSQYLLKIVALLESWRAVARRRLASASSWFCSVFWLHENDFSFSSCGFFFLSLASLNLAPQLPTFCPSTSPANYQWHSQNYLQTHSEHFSAKMDPSYKPTYANG